MSDVKAIGGHHHHHKSESTKGGAAAAAAHAPQQLQQNTGSGHGAANIANQGATQAHGIKTN